MIRFVTGTDTGVGKTVVSAVLAREAREEGRCVVYCKPVQTGLRAGAPGSDADFVGAFAGVAAHELLRFPEPLAPAVAARLAGAVIDVDDLVARVRELDADELLVEGAGGLLVPLTDRATMADLARALDAELVVVARPGLGTLNHTMLSIEAARARSLHVSSIVLSGWPADPGVLETTNAEILRTLAPVRLLRFADGVDVERGLAGFLADG